MPGKTKVIKRPRRPNLDRLLKTWQPRLRIQDWQIVAEYVKADAPNFGGKYGDVQCNEHKRQAYIRVLDPAGADSPHIESTLVHECLHILLWPLAGNFTTDSPQHIAEEQIIAALTDALTEVVYED